MYLVLVMCGMADLLYTKGKGGATDSVVFYRCSTYFPFGLPNTYRFNPHNNPHRMIVANKRLMFSPHNSHL